MLCACILVTSRGGAVVCTSVRSFIDSPYMRVAPFAFLLGLASCHVASPAVGPAATNARVEAPLSAASTASIAAIQADVNYLANPMLRGRAVATPGSGLAAQYILNQYAALGLAGAFEYCNAANTCRTIPTQGFDVDGRQARNLGVIIPGTDSLLRAQYVVIGAHYDHIGTASNLSRDPKAGAVVRPGADDNASGTAAVLELARRLHAHPTKRSILVLNFDAEERGLLGSASFVRHLPVPRSSMVLMVNFDMVGRLRKNELTVDKSVLGLGETRVLAVLDSSAKLYGVTLTYTREIDGRSDHTSFEHVLVPALALFTGFHDDYHTAADVVSKLNVPGIVRVVDIAEIVVRASANR